MKADEPKERPQTIIDESTLIVSGKPTVSGYVPLRGGKYLITFSKYSGPRLRIPASIVRAVPADILARDLVAESYSGTYSMWWTRGDASADGSCWIELPSDGTSQQLSHYLDALDRLVPQPDEQDERLHSATETDMTVKEVTTVRRLLGNLLRKLWS